MKLKSKKLPSKTKKEIPEKFKELKQQLDAINPTNYLTSSVMYLEELEEILDDDDYMKNKKLVEEFLKLMKI
jgi:peptide subunit release factor 1 (eRF1)